jgi:hypothetical protein
VSVTELIRRLVREYLGRPNPAGCPTPEWTRLVGLGSSGKPDLGDNHDRVLGEALTREHLR